MDIYCPRCGEPWDMDCLHDEAGAQYGIPYYLTEQDRKAYSRNPAYDPDQYQKHYEEIRAAFQTQGCSTLTSYGAHCSEQKDTERAGVAAAMYDLLGSDMDGAAAMLEDWEAGY